MDSQEILETTCVLCLKHGGPFDDSIRPVLKRGGLSFECRVCVECAPYFSEGERAIYNHLLPRATANFSRLLGNDPAPPQNSATHA